jgi:hypothetical protein
MAQTTDSKAFRKVTRRAVEGIYARSRRLFDIQATDFASKGMRAAKAQDPTMMRTLEACAETMEAIEESQRGETRRSAKDAMRAKSHEASMFREAYRLADSGKADLVFAYIYTAVAEYAGVIEHGARA